MTVIAEKNAQTFKLAVQVHSPFTRSQILIKDKKTRNMLISAKKSSLNSTSFR